MRDNDLHLCLILEIEYENESESYILKCAKEVLKEIIESAEVYKEVEIEELGGSQKGN